MQLKTEMVLPCRFAVLPQVLIKRCALVALCLVLLCPLLRVQAATLGKKQYLTTAEAFSAALARREPIIYVDDIAFSGDSAYILLNYNVHIVGKENKSTLTDAHFEIVGQVTHEPGKNVTVDFENLRFDGGVAAEDYDLTQEATFEEIFGSYREREGCVRASFGYFDVSFTNCEFTRYAAYRGAAVYCDNDIEFPVVARSITFTGCSFYENIVQYGTCDIFGDQVLTTATDCEFRSNYAMAQAGMGITNGVAVLTNIHIHDNHFIPYDAPNDQLNPGGGMRLSALDVHAKGLVIENNTAYWGGGLALLSAKSGNKEVVLSDCRISGNNALWGGGALHIGSLMGQPVYFRNCEFTDNTAPQGGSLYAIPYAAWNGKYTAGLIDFTFCTFTGNTAEDNTAFSFYETVRPEQNGTIALNGCVVTDEVDRTATGEAPDYTLIGTAALGEAKKLRIPHDGYAAWSQGAYANVEKSLAPGRNEALTAKRTGQSDEAISPAIPSVYAACLLCSALLLLGYAILCKKPQRWLLLLLMSACIVNIGYFCFSVSGSLPTALATHRIAYFGNAFQPVLMLLAVGSICRLKRSRATVGVLFALAAAMFACSATMGVSSLFYKNISYSVVGGVVTLSKEYGPLHTVYQIYVLGTFAALLCIALYAVLRKKVLMPRYVIMTVLAMCANLIIWLIGRLIRASYELLSFSYVITGGLLILIYSGMAEESLPANVGVASAPRGEEAPSVPLLRQPVTVEKTEESQRAACERLVTQKIITRREADVLLFLLQGKNRAEIATELHITENTVKTHITNVYSKLKVSSRYDLQHQLAAMTQAKC